MPEGQVDERKPLEEDDRKALPTGRQAYSGAKLDRRETN